MSRRRPKQHAEPQACGVCGAGILAAFVCAGCMDRYHGNLARVPDVMADLRIEHARLAVKGSGVTGRGSAEPPLPYVPAASDAMTGLWAALTTACRILALGQSDQMPDAGILPVCAWLAEREDAIPLRAEGPDIVAELDAAMGRALHVCDNPPEKVLRGKCFCGTELLSPRGAPVVRCNGCGHQWRGEQLDEALQAHIVDKLAHWAELEGYGHGALRIPRGTLDSWRRRGKLRPLSRSRGGEPLYRVGDMLNLDEQRKTRASLASGCFN